MGVRPARSTDKGKGHQFSFLSNLRDAVGDLCCNPGASILLLICCRCSNVKYFNQFKIVASDYDPPGLNALAHYHSVLLCITRASLLTRINAGGHPLTV